MNDYLSANDIAPVERVTRPAGVVSGAQPGAGAGGGDVHQGPHARFPAVMAGADIAAGSEEHLATAAEYARVHARIADILADLRSGQDASPAALGASEGAVMALMQQPVIVVPLPPASKDMVERAVMLARDMVNHAAASRSAQGHVKPGTVDQILATAA